MIQPSLYSSNFDRTTTRIKKDLIRDIYEKEEESKEFFGKYNLAPEYQYVKASFRDTSSYVEESRAEAQKRL